MHCCSLGSNVLLCHALPSEDANLWTPAFGPQPDGCFLLLFCSVILNNKKAWAVKTMLIPTEETNPSFLLPPQCPHSRFPPARWAAAASFITPTPGWLPHYQPQEQREWQSPWASHHPAHSLLASNAILRANSNSLCMSGTFTKRNLAYVLLWIIRTST